MAVRGFSLMQTISLLTVHEAVPEFLVKAVLVVLRQWHILTELILRRIHLNLHSLLASLRVRDVVLLELRW